MRRPSVTAVRAAAVSMLAAASVAACGLGSAGTPSASNNGEPSGTPITVGISLSKTGQFSADGLASLRGYQLWAADVNSHGGLLGRPVKLVVLNDNSDPGTVKANYTKLITQDHVDLTLGPFSSLLTVPAATVASHYGYAMTAGSATAPTVYAREPAQPVQHQRPGATADGAVRQLGGVAAPGQRPKSAAYAMVADPFADPPVQQAQSILEKAGIATAYSNASAPYQKTTPAALAADADKVAAAHPQIVLIGSVDVPTVSAFINEFKRLRFNPQMIIAAAGPDQGQAVPQPGRHQQRHRDHGPEYLVRRLPERAEPRDGAGIHRQVRRHRLGHQRGRGGGVLGGPGHGGRGRQRGPQPEEDHRLPAQPRHPVRHRPGAGPVGQVREGPAGRPEPQGLRLRLPVAGDRNRFVQVLSLQGKPSPNIVISKPPWTTG